MYSFIEKYELHLSLLLLTVVAFSLIVVVIQSALAQLSNTMQKTTTPLVSTRNHFNFTTGDLIKEYSPLSYNASNIPGLQIGSCPREIAIYMHGAWIDETSANEQFNRTAMSIMANNYTIPLIGFSWDSNTSFNKDGWEIAKSIAEKNGLKLAQFISDFKNKCKNADIRLIAHSLGAVLVNSTLISLSNNQVWNNNNNNDFNITSVHLLGAAIDRNATASNSTFGKDIEIVVDKFYNLRSSEDNMLEYVYRYVEKGDALGLLGIQHSLPVPRNYIEYLVDSEIPPIPDADGNGKLDCFDFFVLLPGDNHCGYIGFRALPPFGNILRDDGAIDIVVRNWSERVND